MQARSIAERSSFEGTPRLIGLIDLICKSESCYHFEGRGEVRPARITRPLIYYVTQSDSAAFDPSAPLVIRSTFAPLREMMTYPFPLRFNLEQAHKSFERSARGTATCVSQKSPPPRVSTLRPSGAETSATAVDLVLRTHTHAPAIFIITRYILPSRRSVLTRYENESGVRRFARIKGQAGRRGSWGRRWSRRERNANAYVAL